MDTSLFFTDQHLQLHAELDLNEDTSKHIVQVLRMRVGDMINITDGMGVFCSAEIVLTSKKNCRIRLIDCKNLPKSRKKTVIAISLLKNAGRWEWFLEKSAELGIDKVIPLICERTERQFFRKDRMKSILVSAMLQSKQCWLTNIEDPITLDQLFQKYNGDTSVFIAHCENTPKPELASLLNSSFDDVMVLIGPEGDFTKDEIEKSIMEGATEVSLGSTRLRTETAAMTVAVLLKHLVG